MLGATPGMAAGPDGAPWRVLRRPRRRRGPIADTDVMAATLDIDTTASLHDGTAIPLLGFGVWQIPDGDECVNAVGWALAAGYRHIDTAQIYGNESSVGRALKEAGIARDRVYVTTKFFPRQDDPVEAIERSLERLQLDHVDLYLVHWPEGGPTWMWEGMQAAQQKGYTRSVGVSNYAVADVDDVLDRRGAQPVVNQVQFSPFENRRRLLDGCTERHVAVEAYSPLGTGRHLGDETVGAVAARLGRTPAQVLIRWCLQRDTIVLPKSAHRERIVENAQVFDFTLSDADLAELDALDTTDGTDTA